MMLNPTFYKPNHKQDWNRTSRTATVRLSTKLKFRIMFSIIFFLLVFSSFLIISSNASSASVRPAADHEQIVSVDSGDTLWSIAKSQYKNEVDVRYGIFLIQERNGLKNESIRPGQKLIIPNL